MKIAVILSAGKGTRMNSVVPKVMHKIGNKPMIEHIVDKLNQLKVNRLITIVGYQKELIIDYLKDKTEYAVQEEQLGTGHAIMQASALKDLRGTTLVVNGDCPLISKKTYDLMFNSINDCSMIVLTAEMEDPKHYGRVLRNQQGHIEKIVEYKDATEDEKNIKEFNTGIYVFNNQDLVEALTKLSNNNKQKEYYITDLVEIMNKEHKKVKALKVEDNNEVMGINNKVELQQATKEYYRQICIKHLENGVNIIDIENTYIDEEVVIGEGTTIYPNNFIKGKTIIGKNNTIFNSLIDNSEIGDDNSIEFAKVIDSKIANQVSVGPFVHIRANSSIGNKNRIGNYVEVKSSSFGENSKASHITYVGDAEIGNDVNLGCGVITVNYDGIAKHKTIIKDRVFVGCNVNLLAPIELGEDSLVAAGSTINLDVPAGNMAIARERQTNKEDYGYKFQEKRKKK